MFSENEYEILNEITKQKNSKLLYIITHSSEKTDKEEIIEMINVGIKSFLEKSRIDNYFEIFSKTKVIKDIVYIRLSSLSKILLHFLERI